MIVPTLLEDLQNAAAARILGDQFLGEIVVLKEQYSSTTDAAGGVTEVEDIEVKILNALGTLNEKNNKLGAVAVVMMPAVENANANLTGLSAELVLRVRYIVNPLFNNGEHGYKKSEGQLALRGGALFQGWSPLDGLNPFSYARNPIESINNDLPPGNNGYEVEHRMRWGVSSGEKVARPTVNVAAGEATITCATAGAAIRYTLDGSAPSAGNAAALVYADPFAVEVGNVIRTAASKADFFESDTTNHTVT
jgi:hypothetical protein